MNPTRMRTLEAGLNSLSRKVYEAVPRTEAWSIDAIVRELARKGFNNDYRAVVRCVKTLAEQGLVVESDEGFMRKPIKPKPALKAVESEAPVPTPEPPAKATPLDRLGEIANWVEGVCKDLNLLKGELETVAIEVQQYLEDIQAKNTKLKQLQDLLKGLAD